MVIGWSVVLGMVALSLGAWPMLPFCGLEITAVVWAWWIFWQRSCYRETMTVDEGAVIAQRWHRRQAPSETLRLQKAWAHVRVEWPSAKAGGRPKAGMTPEQPKVLLQAMGRHFELGCGLGASQRLILARQVQGWLSEVRSMDERWESGQSLAG
jgi:uncharacterized membrane protein